MADRFDGEVVRPALIAGDKGVIQDTTFERCDVKGPVVLIPTGETVIEHNQLDGTAEAIFWVIPPERTTVLGAVEVRDCRFTGCHFMNVGIAGPQAVIDNFVNP